MCVFVRDLCFGDVGRVCSVEAVVGCRLTEKNAAPTQIQVRQRGYRMCGAECGGCTICAEHQAHPAAQRGFGGCCAALRLRFSIPCP